MIEDALKTVRNLHRLILTVSFITLIFSLSLNLPSEKQQQLAHIERLVAFKFDKYEAFVNNKIDEHMSAQYQALADSIVSSLEQGEHLMFNLNNISAAFRRSPHVGKLLTNELILSNPTNATLNSFTALNGLSLSKNVQVLLPDLHEITPVLKDFLRKNAYPAGRRVENVILSIGDVNLTAESSFRGMQQ